MIIASDQDVRDEVRRAFDEAARFHGVTSAQELAKLYGLSSKTITFLRTGRWTRTDRLLIAALLQKRLDERVAA